MIKKDSPVPIYYQVEENIKEKIHSGEWKSGDAIPSERQFCEQYSISRMTVRQAISNLVNEGILERKRGRGTFVSAAKLNQELTGITSFTEQMAEQGKKPETKVLSFEQTSSSKQAAKELGLDQDEEIYKVKRIRLADGEAIAYETLYMPVRLFPDMTKKHAEGSIYDYIENQCGLPIQYGKQELEAAEAGKKAADALKLDEGAPVLKIQRTSFTPDHTAVEYTKTIYRGDRYKYVMELERKHGGI
ncbi:phosphonate metabolism transcriptional regulator PhnF [Bacillus sp. FJAT-42376]|uniref:phosphonate metabolism transcriptional regulator PhnF n=1 Tax=Bacillus sp. FJAT-42376 TaxID=2014076 RepID=UPI000F512DA5|nr:phosphonate metabolism transcriptional regulator PhnF [Bacillus sp. FJAT-42376]AZB41880.1 phosphonate metabolism transcriptional regulator PhnF [Bacillus sp. FJAT-42376]